MAESYGKMSNKIKNKKINVTVCKAIEEALIALIFTLTVFDFASNNAFVHFAP